MFGSPRSSSCDSYTVGMPNREATSGARPLGLLIAEITALRAFFIAGRNRSWAIRAVVSTPQRTALMW